PYSNNDFLQICRLIPGKALQAKKRQGAFRFFLVGGDLTEHAERVRYSSQCRLIQKRTRGQLIAAGLEGPQAGKQIPAVYGRDVPWTQRLESAQVIPIKKMAFETLEPTQRFERAEVALHQLIDGDVTKIVRRDRRQHGQSDVGRRRAHENFTFWRFLDIVRRQPRGLWSNKIIEVSPRSTRDRVQESAILR